MKKLIPLLILIIAQIACATQALPTAPTAPVSTGMDGLFAIGNGAGTIRDTRDLMPIDPDPGTAQVVVPAVRVRDAPNGRAIGFMVSGETVRILFCEDGWCAIEYLACGDTQPCYVWRGCLTDNPDFLGCEAE